jgi:response regulator RpfG family c-di-GMP phosphodiesterase
VGSTVLICDDDPDIRSAMRRTLRGYEIVEAGAPQEALDLLKRKPFDAIVSDYSMDAESDGLDFLQLVKLQYPATVRFLVTASRDLDVAMRAVNEGAVHRYFLKPWSDDRLRSALDILLHARLSEAAS